MSRDVADGRPGRTLAAVYEPSAWSAELAKTCMDCASRPQPEGDFNSLKGKFKILMYEVFSFKDLHKTVPGHLCRLAGVCVNLATLVLHQNDYIYVYIYLGAPVAPFFRAFVRCKEFPLLSQKNALSPEKRAFK